MDNRQPRPGQEGRVLIEPEDGSAPFYAKITMADNPLVKGTPWAKESIWPDDVAQLFSLPTASLPADGFRYIGNLNLHWWAKTKAGQIALAEEIPDAAVYAGNYPTGNYDQYYYADSVSVSSDNLTISLNNPKTFNAGYENAEAFSVLAGKYFYREGGSTADFPNDVIAYCRPGSVPTKQSGGGWYKVCLPVSILYIDNQITDVEYVYSQYRDTYPDDGVVDGYMYRYLGEPLENAKNSVKFLMGQYRGTGEYGQDHPNSISAPGKILAAVLFSGGSVSFANSSWRGMQIYYGLTEEYQAGFGFGYSGNGTLFGKTNAHGSVWSWYHTGYDEGQMNNLGTTYQYLILYV